MSKLVNATFYSGGWSVSEVDRCIAIAMSWWSRSANQLSSHHHSVDEKAIQVWDASSNKQQPHPQVVGQVMQTQRPGWVRFTEVSRHSAPGLTSTRVAHVVLLTTPNPTHSWKAFFLPRSLSGVGLFHAKDYWHLSSMKGLYLLLIPWTSKRNMTFNFKICKSNIFFPAVCK